MKIAESQLRRLIRKQIAEDVPVPDTNIIAEARERWAGLVLEAGIRDLREEAEELSLMCEAQTVEDILSVFDEKAGGLDDQFKAIIGDIVNIVVEQAKNIKPEIFEDMDVDSPEEAAEQLSGMLLDMGENFKEMGTEYQANKEDKGARIAAADAFKSNAGRDAIDAATELKDNDLVKGAAKAAGGEFVKKLLTKIAEFVPFGKQVMDAVKMVAGVAKIGGKLKGLMKKFKKSKASPQDKFADFAEKVARGPDQELGDFASVLQMNDDLEEVLDDRLEVKYVKDYVDKLRSVDPSTSVDDININELITQWIKEDEGLADTDLDVSV